MGTVLCVVAAASCLSASAAAAQQPPAPKGRPAVDQVRVDAAIRKGVEYLKGQGSSFKPDKKGPALMTTDELVLYTFAHAGVPETDPDFQALLQKILERPLTATYSVALQAMVLEELDRVKYQRRIWECAQFLVDNQAKNGQWSYGEPTTLPKDVPTGAAPRKDVSTSGARPARKGAPTVRTKPPVQTRLPVVQQRTVGNSGDNSNSQYAALGLRACHDAGIVLPREVVERAAAWWRSSQAPDDSKEKSPYGAIRGWGYREGDSRGAYGSMTAGALGSLVICHYILSSPWMKDPSVQAGLNWLAANFSVSENVDAPDKHGQKYYFYYLYALERAGILYGTEKFGRHEWYPEGVKVLLEAQKPDGSWEKEKEPVWDTCFAILFLRRATRPLVDVASVDRFQR